MGAPKQKWTVDEEAALKAGVIKHGTGKWRTILSDPEFSSILKSRSNVDLKDKWRNISVTAIWGSRKRAKLALKKTSSAPKQDDDPNALSIVPHANDESTPLAVSSGTPQTDGLKRPITSLDKIILEAVTNLKELRGSDRTSIFMYIEETFRTPPNMKRLVATRLKHLTTIGTLIKTKHKYRIAPGSTTSGTRQRSPQQHSQGQEEDCSKTATNDINVVTKSHINGELLRIKGMTALEAAAAAARAVAAAEFAIAEAEQAAQEAEKADAEAEAAQIFAKAAMKALKCRMRSTWLVFE